MKKFICPIVVFLAAVFFHSPFIQAQDQVDTVRLSVNSDNRINVDALTVNVRERGNIVFETNESHTFTITIDNYDHFIDNQVTHIMLNVSSENPARITIDSPPDNDTVKVYSVGIIVTKPHKPIPLPPAAPPRIVLNRD